MEEVNSYMVHLEGSLWDEFWDSLPSGGISIFIKDYQLFVPDRFILGYFWRSRKDGSFEPKKGESFFCDDVDHLREYQERIGQVKSRDRIPINTQESNLEFIANQRGIYLPTNTGLRQRAPLVMKYLG